MFIPALVSIGTLLIMDVLWVLFVMGKLYSPVIERIQGESMQVRAWSVVFSYLLMVVGLVAFVLPRVHGYADAVLYGGLYGFILYGVYNFTVSAVIRKWSNALILIDVAWGSFVYAVSACVYWASVRSMGY